MRVLFIADVHANLAALQALPPADAVLCAGDVVTYGPEPEATVQALRAMGAGCVRGEEDDAVANGADHVVPPDLEEAGLATRLWSRSALSPESIEWLAHLPPELERTIDGQHVALVHAYPGDFERYLVPTDEELRRLARAFPRANIIVTGHTHRPATWRVGETLIVNPGSVGQPARPGRASYALLVDGRLEFGEAAFDVGATLAALGAIPLSTAARRQCEGSLLRGSRRPHGRLPNRDALLRRSAVAAGP